MFFKGVALPKTVWFRYREVAIPGTVDIADDPLHSSDIKDISSTHLLHHWDKYCESDDIPPEFICGIDYSLLVAPVLDRKGYTYNLPAQIKYFKTHVPENPSSKTIKLRSAFSREIVDEISTTTRLFAVFNNWYLERQLVNWVTLRIGVHLKSNNSQAIKDLHLRVVKEWGLTSSTTETSLPEVQADHPYLNPSRYVALYQQMFNDVPGTDEPLFRQIQSYKNGIGRWADIYLTLKQDGETAFHTGHDIPPGTPHQPTPSE